MMTREFQELISSLITKVNHLERIIADLVGQETPVDEAAQDAVGAILTDTATIDFTYTDATPSITADVKDGSITLAKMQDIATDKLLGRATAGTGDIELITLTAYARTLIAAINAAAGRTTLELGTMATAAETAYALLAGRASGQTLNGDTAANGNIIINGTAHATKTTSYVLIQPNGGNTAIGSAITAPSGVLHAGATAFADTVLFERTGQTTDVFSASMRLLVTKTTNMADGFGPGFALAIRDDAGVVNYIGVIGAVRAGADNTGDIVIAPVVAGVTTERVRITSAGAMGVDIGVPLAKLHVEQASTTAAIPTLRLKQADLSEEFIRLDTTVGAGNPIDTAAAGTRYGKFRVYVEGVGIKTVELYNP